MKTLKCRDAGFDCAGEIRAESVEEVLQQAAAHAKAEHQIEVTPELAEQLKSLIREEA